MKYPIWPNIFETHIYKVRKEKKKIAKLKRNEKKREG